MKGTVRLDYAVEVGPVTADEVNEYTDALSEAIFEDTRRLAQHETDIMQDAAERLLSDANLTAEHDSPEYRRLLYELLSATLLLSKRQLEALRPDTPPAVTSPKSTPRISEVCRDYVENSRVSQNWSGKTLAARTGERAID